MVDWKLLIKPNETVEGAWTLPALKAALTVRSVPFNKKKASIPVLFQQLLEWNRNEYPCLDASEKLSSTDQKMSRWDIDQIRVALFFRDIEFEPLDSKKTLFKLLIDWEKSTFPPAPGRAKRRGSEVAPDSDNDSSSSEDEEVLVQKFLADLRANKKGSGKKRKAAKTPAPEEPESSSDEGSRSTRARHTAKKKPKARKRRNVTVSEEGPDEDEHDVDDLFTGLYSSPKAPKGPKGVMVSLPYADVWASSFATIVDNDRKSKHFKTLVHTTASECEVSNVLFLYSEQAFYLYRVSEVDSSQIKVVLISDNADTAPFANCKISAAASITGLSITCIAHVKAHFHLAVTWPTDKQGKESVKAMTALITPAASKTKTSESDLTRAIRSALRDDDGPSGASKKSTPRGQGLTEAAADVLSRDADKVLKTGNMVVFNRLYYLCPTDSEAVFWSVEKWRCQLQPAHLLQMVRSVASVDIRLFAYTADVLGTTAADRISLTQQQQLDEKPGAYVPRLDLLDGSVIRMEQCLRLFACTIDVLFCLQQEIRIALQTAIIRVSLCTRALNTSPGDPEAPVLLLFLARDFQLMVSHVLGPVLGENHASMALVVDGISNYPDMSATSRFNADVAHTRLHKTLPASTLMDLCATPSKKPTPPRLPGKDGKDGKVGSPTPSQLICGFFHSTQGCQKDPCDRAHRAPSSQKETKSLESFFKTYKKLTRK